jgi:hypothetical protein
MGCQVPRAGAALGGAGPLALSKFNVPGSKFKEGAVSFALTIELKVPTFDTEALVDR